MMRTTIHDGTLFICLQYAPLVPVRVRLVYLPVCQKSNGRAIWPSAGFAAAIHAPSWVQGGESSATVVPYGCERKVAAKARRKLCLDLNFRVSKYTVAFRLYLIIIVQPLTN
jgi:hypothetical protein